MDILLSRLRAADEDDIREAFKGAYIKPPLTKPEELLEFWNRMLDVLTGEVER